MIEIPKIPVGEWVDTLVSNINNSFSGFFGFVGDIVGGFYNGIVSALTIFPWIVIIPVLACLAYFTTRRIPFSIFTVAGLLFIVSLGFWEQTMSTLALVLTAVLFSIIIGIPLGIWISQSNRAAGILTPLLDFAQTMPAFVYLIPAILFFGIGVVPGIIASVIFAMPPTIRLTNLGIRQVPRELTEAAEAFGSTTWQKLLKVELPLAAGTIMAGINQSIMLALSMVVISSLVGAPGLGVEVYRAVTRIQVGLGFEAGLAIVILAIILDRITQNLKLRN
ncbi:ABC transporter permease subunit [Bacillus lacus]|uniref:ABC transporter permease subunit n=1 Tax=Metabacillus lacus TaxID=1983721 RepID=A0A7X2IXW8_9BACI|nr:proline/glycine betaine ABC transporter permease [Metabacillus lacus]MRX71634.1 ABC transporter permease subunit [Metabacillus lacus]